MARWVGHVVNMSVHRRFWLEHLKGRDMLGDIGVNGRMILKCIWGWRVWIEHGNHSGFVNGGDFLTSYASTQFCYFKFLFLLWWRGKDLHSQPKFSITYGLCWVHMVFHINLQVSYKPEWYSYQKCNITLLRANGGTEMKLNMMKTHIKVLREGFKHTICQDLKSPTF